MARGTGLRNKKMTIKLTEEEESKVRRDAEYNNISISEHGRQKILSDTQDTEILTQMCNLFTALNKVMRKYDISQEDKALIEKEADLVWQRLN